MPSAFDALLSTIISRAASEIAGAVRANMADEVLRAVEAQVPSAPGARAVPVAARVGRKSRVARVPTVKAVPAKPSRGRKSGKASGLDALQGEVLGVIAKTAGLRAEEITKRLRAKPEAVKATLAALREAGRVKVSGRARGTRYAVA